MTVDGLIAEMDKALQFPGVSNAWTMPIKARIDMLATGIRTPVGIKVLGTDLGEMDQLARQIEAVVKTVPGTSSAYAERVIGGYYLDITPDREALARYGLMVGDVQDTVATALGGETITTTVEGRERYGVNLRYPRDLRSDRSRSRARCWCRCPAAARCRWARSPPSSSTRGPTTIRTENGQLAVYIFVDIRDRDLGGYVADAKAAVAASVKFPPGTYVDVERPVRISRARHGPAEDRGAGDAADHLPAALSQLPPPDRDPDRHAVAAVRAGRRLLADVVARLQPVGRGGGRLHRAGRRRRGDRRHHADLSRSCHGRDQQSGARRKAGRSPATTCDEAIMLGAVERVRPKMMTVVAIMAGLLPILWSTGTGSEVMQRIAVPMIGGMISSTVLTLIVIPAVYGLVKGFGLPSGNDNSHPTSVRSKTTAERTRIPEPAE